MKASIRRDYFAMCPIDAPQEVVEYLVEQISTAIQREEELKNMGFNIDKLIDDLY